MDATICLPEKKGDGDDGGKGVGKNKKDSEPCMRLECNVGHVHHPTVFFLLSQNGGAGRHKFIGCAKKKERTK